MFNVIASGGENEAIVKMTLGIDINEELKEPRTISEFEKFFDRRCLDSMQKYTYLRVMGLQCLSRLCKKVEFDSNLFLGVIKCFKEQVLNNETFNNKDEQYFMANWLAVVCFESDGFDFVLEFLIDEEKQGVKEFIDKLDKVDTELLRKQMALWKKEHVIGLEFMRFFAGFK